MRTDIHSPKNINPKEYTFVGLRYVGPSNVGQELASDYVNPLKSHFQKTGGKMSDHNHKGSCHVCGANAHYLAVYYHADTNTYIQTGFDCATKMDMQKESVFQKFTKDVAQAREWVAGKTKAIEFLKEKGLEECWNIYSLESTPNFFEEFTITDIVAKLIRYGSISEKQESFLRKLLKQISQRAVKLEKRKEEWEAAAPCPEGRITVVGKVLTVKFKDTGFGMTRKILVQSEEGFKVWGSAPSSVKVPAILGDDEPVSIQVGDRISFSAKVFPSKDDVKFGFYSRPTRAEILEFAPREEELHVHPE